MTDYFALLNEQRRPWIDPELLKQKFLALSAEVHPDRVHGAPESEKREAQQRYAEFNAAYNCLREPKDRLAHLIELETGAKPTQVQNVPSDLMDAFMEMTNLCKAADTLLGTKSATSSPLLQLQFFEQGQELTEKLMEQQRKINSWHESMMAQLKGIDAQWEQNRDAKSDQQNRLLWLLQKQCQLLGYFGRWGAQVQERIVLLSM